MDNLSGLIAVQFWTCFKKMIPNLGYSRHWTTAKKMDFYLPVHADGSIAYDYMNDYVTAVE